MEKKITMEAIRLFAAASGDAAAFHTDPEAAKAAGFKGPVAHGMYIMGIAHSMYLSQHSEQWIKSSRMRFMKPAWADTVARFDYDCANHEIQVTVTGENGETLANGSFSVGGKVDDF
ncbi:MaoC family dehydratase [Paenibacillus glucanolyticus]|uniref:MaoC family dehydratase n=1 Tax=Paenibacillus glucanolyticus TaxID=59843 RepID=UPI00128CE657|nr:MaoC family dehydratase [Paenibacillus glucanolyticus]MPY17580.1 hypothetical protein [Paenibacillus glucanolyticus]